MFWDAYHSSFIKELKKKTLLVSFQFYFGLCKHHGNNPFAIIAFQDFQQKCKGSIS
jgi:hypothetical protein